MSTSSSSTECPTDQADSNQASDMTKPSGHLALLGGGQLARMLAMAAAELGVPVRSLDPDPDAPVADVGQHRVAAYDDTEALAWLLDGARAVTWEREDIPLTHAVDNGSACSCCRSDDDRARPIQSKIVI